jgi:hypothetical protein
VRLERIFADYSLNLTDILVRDGRARLADRPGLL